MTPPEDPYLARLTARFWGKVQPCERSGCWLWVAAQDRKGYGKFWFKGKSRWAHRLVKRFRRTAHHTCFTPNCVNPDHLQDVSRAKNSHFGHDPSMKKYLSWVENSESEQAPF